MRRPGSRGAASTGVGPARCIDRHRPRPVRRRPSPVRRMHQIRPTLGHRPRNGASDAPRTTPRCAGCPKKGPRAPAGPNLVHLPHQTWGVDAAPGEVHLPLQGPEHRYRTGAGGVDAAPRPRASMPHGGPGHRSRTGGRGRQPRRRRRASPAGIAPGQVIGNGSPPDEPAAAVMNAVPEREPSGGGSCGRQGSRRRRFGTSDAPGNQGVQPPLTRISSSRLRAQRAQISTVRCSVRASHEPINGIHRAIGSAGWRHILSSEPVSLG